MGHSDAGVDGFPIPRPVLLRILNQGGPIRTDDKSETSHGLLWFSSKWTIAEVWTVRKHWLPSELLFGVPKTLHWPRKPLCRRLLAIPQVSKTGFSKQR
jgi:hypothetical protein